jgi:hypothetical protein
MAPMAKKNKIEKNAPRILSAMNAAFIIDVDQFCISGIIGGSIMSLVPDRMTVKLKIITPAIV